MTEQAKKICPIRRTDGIAAECLGEKCACYISLVKPIYLTKDIIDPEDCYRYEGCGLVSNVPLTLTKRPEKKGPQQ